MYSYASIRKIDMFLNEISYYNDKVGKPSLARYNCRRCSFFFLAHEYRNIYLES